MSFPFPSDYSNPASPSFQWDLEDPTGQASASISPEVLQQQSPHHLQDLSLHPQQPPQEQPYQQPQASLSSVASVYQAPPTIQIQERVPPSQFRFDNLDVSHFQQQAQAQEAQPRSSTRSSSRKPSSLRVAVDQSRPSTASSSLGPSRVPHGSRQHAQTSHPYRRASDGAGPSTSAGGARTQTGSRRARNGESGGEQPRHDIHERQSRLGVGSDSALVGLMRPMVGSGEGTPVVACPAMHSWRFQSTPSHQPTQTVAAAQQHGVSGASSSAPGVDAATRCASRSSPDGRDQGLHVSFPFFLLSALSPEATSPLPIPTPGSAHTPAASTHTPQMPTADDFAIPSVPQASRTSSMPPPPLQQYLPEPVKRYSIRTDIHFDPAAKTLTAMFELPGIKKSDVNIDIRNCPYSGVRQVMIYGRSYPLLPQTGFVVAERKFGEYKRMLVVPLHTQVRLAGLVSCCP